MKRVVNLLVYASIGALSVVCLAQLGIASELQSQQATLGKANLGYGQGAAMQAKNKGPSTAELDNLPVLKYLANLTSEGWTIGWSFTGPFRVDQNLSNIIGTDLLQEYRCASQAKQILQRGNRKIVIDAMQCATADGAFGVYCAAHRGSSSYSVQGDASAEDQESISFCKGPYFICLQSSEQDDQEAKAVINTLAQKLVAHIQAIERPQQASNPKPFETSNPYSGKPKLFTFMPSLQRVHGSEKLIMGPIGMRRFFAAPYSVNLAPLTEGAVADYRLEEPRRDRLKLLIAYYPTAQAAAMMYGNYVSTLNAQNKEKSVEGFTYQTTLFKIGDIFLLCQLRDKQVIVINGARHKDTAEELAHQIFF